MSKTLKIILIVFSVLVAGALTVWFVTRRKQKVVPSPEAGDNALASTEEIPEESNYAGKKPCPECAKKKVNDKAFPLVMGNQGREVEQLQLFLIKLLGEEGKKVDFGEEYGRIGEQTMALMVERLGTNQITQEDFYQAQMQGYKTYKYKK